MPFFALFYADYGDFEKMPCDYLVTIKLIRYHQITSKKGRFPGPISMFTLLL